MSVIAWLHSLTGIVGENTSFTPAFGGSACSPLQFLLTLDNQADQGPMGVEFTSVSWGQRGMPLRLKSPLFLLFAALLILPNFQSAAQAPSRPQRPPDGGTREVLVSIFIPSLANAPFTATVNTESVRQLADGTTITLNNHRAIARDKAGRIFQERRLLVPDDGKHESVVTQIEISDPVAHKLYICVPEEHVCQLEQFSAPEFAPPPAVGVAANQPGGPSREDLGKQSIDGLEVVGTLETGVIESGAIGNNSPMLVKREFWYSPQLGVNLISKRQDPRFGTQNFEVSDIVLGEPEARIFELPSGFKVIDLRRATTPSSPAQSPN